MNYKTLQNTQELYGINYKILLKDVEEPNKQRNRPGFLNVEINITEM